MASLTSPTVLGFLYGFAPALALYVLIIASKLFRYAFFAAAIVMIALSLRFYTGHGLVLVLHDLARMVTVVPPAALGGVFAAFLSAPFIAQLFRRRPAP